MSRDQGACDARVGPALALFAAAFVLSRIVLWYCGMRYCTEHVGAIMHFPPLDLLRDRLGETLWYMHGQPPLPSLVIGLCLKWGGASWETLLAALFHGLAAAAGGALVVVLRRGGRSVVTSLAIAISFTLLPGFLAYEYYAFTTLPVMALLLLACVPLQRAVATGRARSWFWFLLFTALVVNTRNVFHLVWWACCLVLMLRCGRLPWRRAVLVAALPAALAILPFAKNAIVHGTFASSTWMGFGFARKTYHQEPLEQRQQRVLAGTAAPITGVPIYGSVAEFAKVVPMPPPSGIPILDRLEKDWALDKALVRTGDLEEEADGVPNYHHAIYIEASRQMRDEGLAEIRRHPRAYLHNVVVTFWQFFEPGKAWGPLATPRAQLGRWGEGVDYALHEPWLVGTANTWLLLTVLAAACGLVALRSLWRPSASSRGCSDIVAVFAIGTVLYVIVLGVLVETNEVMRLRQKVDGLIVLTLALASWRVQTKRQPSPPAPTP